jgi:trimethylamine:corrinoid methyltransferase-like protein
MNDRMQVFTRDEINLIHDASMEILAETGIKFNSEEALNLFRQNGFNVTNPRVFITEKEVMRALETVPSRFIVHARNPRTMWPSAKMTLFFCLPPGPPMYPMPTGSAGRQSWMTITPPASWYRRLTSWT